MEDVLGLRGAENHPPPAALVSIKSAHDDRITAGSRVNQSGCIWAGGVCCWSEAHRLANSQCQKLAFTIRVKCSQHKRMDADTPKPRPAGFGTGLIGVMWALAHHKGKYSLGLWKVLRLDVSDCFGFIPQVLRDKLRVRRLQYPHTEAICPSLTELMS
jgi:hypothetical protein